MKNAYQWLPAVEKLIHHPDFRDLNGISLPLLTDAARDALNEFRVAIHSGEPLFKNKEGLEEALLKRVKDILRLRATPSLKAVINATGVVLHTNIGRAPLALDAKKAAQAAYGYCNLELDLETGLRGNRYDHLRPLLLALTGAEDCLVVNNNAAAVLLALNTLAKNREVIISRSELIEIGGSFRIPDIIETGCVKLVEVGASNRTHLEDFERAVSAETALILRVHRSNFTLAGYVEDVPLEALADLAHRCRAPLLDNLGSGCLYPLADKGIGSEPTVREELGKGADILTFSGDKLLGGPQAGIIVGKKEYLARMEKNPLYRALRPDKITVAALEATLRLYQDMAKAAREIPILYMLLREKEELKSAAVYLKERLEPIPGATVQIEEGLSEVGGGALPEVKLPTWLLSVKSQKISANQLSRLLRQGDPAILTYIREEKIIFDMRTILADQLDLIAARLVPLLA